MSYEGRRPLSTPARQLILVHVQVLRVRWGAYTGDQAQGQSVVV